MTPNLKRLFEEAGTDPATETELNTAQVATMVLFDLFHAHGEALIEALEKLHRDSTASDFNEHWESYTNATQLLAQLEQEAQP